MRVRLGADLLFTSSNSGLETLFDLAYLLTQCLQLVLGSLKVAQTCSLLSELLEIILNNGQRLIEFCREGIEIYLILVNLFVLTLLVILELLS
jgi:hypothetical protein